MRHLKDEAFSDLLDGVAGKSAEEHVASCAACRAQLESLERLRARLRDLPLEEAPPGLWDGIEARLSADPAKRRRMGWPSLVALQVAAMAAVFVIGLGLGSLFSDEGSEIAVPSDGGAVTSVTTAAEAPPASLEEAMAEVARQGEEYQAALRRLETMAQQAGTPIPAMTAERLAALDVLVEATRTALASDPADPVLNSYLFAALEERDAVMRELAVARSRTDSTQWR